MKVSPTTISTPEPETPAPDQPTSTLPPGSAAPINPPATVDQSGFFSGFDLMLAGGVVVLAFAVSSFAIRNSDFWMHLGTGRLIAQGDYEFGRAPFTFSGADRYYTNHSWLYDLGLYSLYSAGNENGDGVVVAAKAAAVVLLALMLLLMTRSEKTLLFSVLAVGLALLASAPQLLLQPILGSFLFFGATLYVLTKMPAKEGSYRMPIAIAILFWVWASVDAWFFIGPLTVLLYLLGQMIQRAFSESPPEDSRVETRTLAIALIAGCIACSLTPHHIHIWQLPPELASRELAREFSNDPELGYQFQTTIGALDFTGKRGGNPVNSIALALLVVLSLFGFAVNFEKISVGLAAIWLPMLGLALLRTRAIPFFAIIAAVTIAMNLGSFARTYAQSTGPGILTLRYGSRVLTFFVGVAALIASWAGWLQPFGEQRRLAWSAEIDESLKRTAEEIQQWRTRAVNPLPPDVHGLAMQIGLADYCAWFAPAEKSYFDGRLSFHIPEVNSYIKIRQIMNPIKADDARKANQALSPKEIEEKKESTGKVVNDFFQSQSIVYLIQGSPRQTENINFLSLRWNHRTFEPWAFNGRVVVMGWMGQKVMAKAHFSAMRFDPVKKAFGPDVKPLPSPELSPPVTRTGLIERFILPPPSAPAEADEAILLNEWMTIQAFQYMLSYQLTAQCLSITQIFLNPQWNIVPGQPITLVPELSATGVLALRAARKAIALSPQSPQGYLALAMVYANEYVPTAIKDTPNMTAEIRVIELQRFLARTTPQEQKDRGNYKAYRWAIEVCRYQKDLERRDHPTQFLDAPFSDLRLQYTKLVRAYFRSLPDDQVDRDTLNEIREFLEMATIGESSKQQNISPAIVEETNKKMDKNIQEWENRVKEQNDLYQGKVQQVTSPVRRGMQARAGHSLYLKALEELKNFNRDEATATVDEQFLAVLSITDLFLAAGQVEAAVEQIAAADEEMKSFPSKFYAILVQSKVPPQQMQQQMQIIQQGLAEWRKIKLRAYCAQGNLHEVVEMLRAEAIGYRDQSPPQGWNPKWGEMPRNPEWLLTGRLFPQFQQLMTETAGDLAKHAGAAVPLHIPAVRFSGPDGRMTHYFQPSQLDAVGEFATRRINQMSTFHLNLAYAYLEEGENAKARQQFEHAARPFELDVQHQNRRVSEYYLKLLEQKR
jgi:tetratricopeptide (TPR) repeat protein